MFVQYRLFIYFASPSSIILVISFSKAATIISIIAKDNTRAVLLYTDKTL